MAQGKLKATEQAIASAAVAAYRVCINKRKVGATDLQPILAGIAASNKTISETACRMLVEPAEFARRRPGIFTCSLVATTA